ncbi:MAG: hypothetical protein IT531_06595 [Burkholderiales bacterium]|nr:hypothetical protein [Burkholderiales bacterium]
MKSVCIRFLSLVLTLFAPLAGAAMEEGGALAPEPTVNVVWVGVFLVLFVGVCVWIGVAIWRAERRSKQSGKDA